MQFSENIRIRYFIIIALAIGLYANTLFHEFVLDDDVVISANMFVQKGVAGIPDIFTHDSFAGYQKVVHGDNMLEGGRYRPLTVAFFAVLYSFFGSDPLPFHFFSIILFAVASLFLYHWLRSLFNSTAGGEWIAFLTTLLFVAHPLHTEVVANVKSIDETLALLLGIGAMYSLLRSFDGKSKMWMVLSFIFMVAACLAKEIAITFLLVAPLSVYFFRKTKISSLAVHMLPILAGSIAFLWIRYTVIGLLPPGTMMHDPLNNPFLEWVDNKWVACSLATKAATIFFTFGLSVLLMVFPHPLTHDYYPFHIQLQSFSNPWVLLSVILFVIMLGYAIWGIIKKKKEVFGILFFLITASVTANVFFPVGVFMAERFLFLPSVGFLIAFTMLGFQLAGEENRKIVLAIFTLIIAVFSVLTIIRNPAWKNNETLLRTDVLHSPNSAKGQNDFATKLLDSAVMTQDTAQRRALLTEASPHFQRAIELHPTYYDAYLASGACAFYLGQFNKSVNLYFAASNLFPGEAKAKTGLWYALQAYGRDQWARHDTTDIPFKALTQAWNMQQDTKIASDLANYYQSIGDLEKAKEWREKTELRFN